MQQNTDSEVNAIVEKNQGHIGQYGHTEILYCQSTTLGGQNIIS